MDVGYLCWRCFFSGWEDGHVPILWLVLCCLEVHEIAPSSKRGCNCQSLTSTLCIATHRALGGLWARSGPSGSGWRAFPLRPTWTARDRKFWATFNPFWATLGYSGPSFGATLSKSWATFGCSGPMTLRPQGAFQVDSNRQPWSWRFSYLEICLDRPKQEGEPAC